MVAIALSAEPPAGVRIGVANGHRFVEKTNDILRYLAMTRRVPAPH